MYPVRSSLKQSICKKYEIDYKSVTTHEAKKIQLRNIKDK